MCPTERRGKCGDGDADSVGLAGFGIYEAAGKEGVGRFGNIAADVLGFLAVVAVVFVVGGANIAVAVVLIFADLLLFYLSDRSTAICGGVCHRFVGIHPILRLEGGLSGP